MNSPIPKYKNKNTASLEAAQNFCAEQLMIADRDLYRLTLFAKNEERQVLQAIFLLVCEIEKIPSLAQDPMMASIRLKWWYDSIENLLNEDSQPPQDTTTLLLVALRDSHQKSLIDIPSLLELIDLMQTEINTKLEIQNKELNDYIKDKSSKILKSIKRDKHYLSIYYRLFLIRNNLKIDFNIEKKENLPNFEKKCLAYTNIMAAKQKKGQEHSLTPFDLIKLYFA